MPDTDSLREKAEAVHGGFPHGEGAEEWYEYRDAFHPNIALAALDVIAAAEEKARCPFCAMSRHDDTLHDEGCPLRDWQETR